MHNWIKSYKKRYIFVLAILVGLLVTTNVYAIWITSISSATTYHITSEGDGGFTILSQLGGGTLISSNASINISQNFTFNYASQSTTMNLAASINKTLANNNCTSWQNDCNVYLTYYNSTYYNSTYYNSTYYSSAYNTTELINNVMFYSNIFILNGQNNLLIKLVCKPYSCPQNISVAINITKLP